MRPNSSQSINGDLLVFALKAFPGQLRLRFMNRGGSDVTAVDTAHPNGTQNTEIGTKAEDYAEKVWLQIEAFNPFIPTQIQDTNASVGIVEYPNPDYTQDTSFFYDGRYGSTLLDASGKIGGDLQGTYLPMAHGKARVNLSAVADSRRYKADRSFVLPPYEGSYGAWLQPIPSSLFDPWLPLPGEFLWLSHWVDERTYARRRTDPTTSWTTPDAPNGVRDWLEKKTWDTWTDTPDDGTGQLDAACRIPTAIWENCTQSEAGLVISTTPWLVTFNPLTPQLRHPADPYWCKFYYGFYEKDPPDGFPAIALHESRHSWQFTLTSRGGVDDDGDILFAPGSIPAASAELLDAPNVAAPGGANGDGHFKGDSFADTGEAVRTMREHEAARFTRRLGDNFAQEVSCALSTFDVVSGDAQTGPPNQPLPQPLVVRALAQNSDAAGNIFNVARSGTTVKFSVLSGNATMNGGSEAFAMTDDSGQASMAVLNGSGDSQIQALLIPPMAPQNDCGSRGPDGLLIQPLAPALTLTIHVR